MSDLTRLPLDAVIACLEGIMGNAKGNLYRYRHALETGADVG